MYSKTKEVAVQLPTDAVNHGSCRWLWIATTAVIIVIAISLRLTLNFRHSMAPGMDAANYPMQTQWMLRHGEMLKPDRPLIFWLNAVATKLMMSVTEVSLADASMLVSRLIDGFCQPWTAVPIMMLGYTWSQGRRTAIPNCAAAAVLAVISPPIMVMLSNLQKNSLGLVWMALSMWAMRQALAQPKSCWHWAKLALIYALACITHVGAFAVTGVMIGGCLAGYALWGSERLSSRSNFLLTATAGVGFAVLALVIWWADPSKSGSFANLPSMLRTHLFPPSLVLALVVYMLLAFILRLLWKQRHELPRCDVAIAVGAVVGLAVLVIPVLEGKWAMRFLLMTPIPVALLLTFLTTHFEMERRYAWTTRGLIAVVLLLALGAPLAIQGPIISEDAAAELAALRQKISNPEKTLVLAPHGLQLWAGYLMSTQVRSRELPEDLSSFERVLILKPTSNMAGHGPPRPGPPGRWEPPERRRPEPDPHDLKIPADAREIYSSHLFTLFEVDK